MLPIVDDAGRPFSYVLTEEALDLLHRIDQQMAGRLQAPEVVVNPATRDRYLVSGLMEEAISSSLLEGASTTRLDAKRLLRSGRKPRTTAERMVVANYKAMQLIRGDLSAPLTMEMVLKIHRTVTEGTLHAKDAGRMQTPDETRVYVASGHSEVRLHVPPPASELPGLMETLLALANQSDETPLLHPVVRAIALHFYLAYLHPFVDGNGRTARALFYRSLLRQGYWLVEFLAISRLLLRAPARYGRSFLHTENDDGDFTYFLLYQLEVLNRAIEELFGYLERKAAEVRQVEWRLRRGSDFNRRQAALIGHALRHVDAIYTIQSHRASHDVAYQTARTDLLDLERRGLLARRKAGNQYLFFPVSGLPERMGAADRDPPS